MLLFLTKEDFFCVKRTDSCLPLRRWKKTDERRLRKKETEREREGERERERERAREREGERERG